MIAIVALLGLVADPPAPRAVVVTTDCGAEVDDQWALAHLALSPEVAIKGVVTTHAPSLKAPAAETAAEVAREVFAKMGVEAPPIAAGSSVPLGEDGRPRDNAGVRLLLDAAKGHSPADRLTVVMIGAATDVASALLIDPAWGDRVRVVAMAFDGWPGGGDPWNVKNDVRAWQVVMGSRAPIVVGDARVTKRRLLQTPKSARDQFAAKGPRGEYLASLLEGWIAREPRLVESASGRVGTWPIWDEVVVAHLLGMTTQEDRPRPALRDDRTFDHDRKRGSITWITEVDADRLWDDLARKLGRSP